jgi:hypothetical protein
LNNSSYRILDSNPEQLSLHLIGFILVSTDTMGNQSHLDQGMKLSKMLVHLDISTQLKL